MINEMKNQVVVVTTRYRGTYVGTLKSFNRKTEQVVLTDARMVIHWGTMHGYQQLAAEGPTDKTKYASKSPMAWIPGVTSVDLCTEVATASWKAAK